MDGWMEGEVDGQTIALISFTQSLSKDSHDLFWSRKNRESKHKG